MNRKLITKSYAYFLAYFLPVGALLTMIPICMGLINPWYWLWMYLLVSVAGTGLSVGYHRLLTHRAFEAPAPVRYILVLMGMTMLQGPPLQWASTHIRHHAYTDADGDPHSPIHGFWHSHCLWMFKDPTPVVKSIFAKHLYRDPICMHFTKHYNKYALAILLWPLLISWQAFLMLSIMRLFFCQHIVWSINSVCHKWGQRPYQTNDNSTNNWIVALFTYGEGWHNNHHHKPHAARIGEHWWQIDIGKYLILFLQKCRLAHNLR